MPPLDGVRVHGFHPRVVADPGVLNAGELVYAIADGAGFVKIGRTRGSPEIRLRDLQTGNPRPLALVGYTSTVSERQLHRRLGRWRTHGEWFRATPQVLAELVGWDFVDVAALDALRRAARG
jgi:hypothetical protein